MAQQNQFRLLIERRFSFFFVAQLLGAFNDNLFKGYFVLLMTYQASSWTTLSPGILANLAAGVFILPFVLFSGTAGQVADKYDKAVVMQVIKAVEVCIALLALLGFFLHSFWLLIAVLFMLGTHSAWYGPVKYSILGRVLAEDELIGGNGLVEMGTFLAILTGTLFAGTFAANKVSGIEVSMLLTILALIGLICSLLIPPTGKAAPDLRIDLTFFRPTAAVMRDATANNSVWLAMVGISWFWFFGALVLTQLPSLGKVSLGGTETLVTWLLAVFSVGVGVGSMLCEKLSRRQVQIGIVPLGAIGLSLFTADLYFATEAYSRAGLPYRVLIDLCLVGLFGGVYIVPLYAMVLARSDSSKHSRMIAANNILNAAFMVASAGIGAGLLAAGLSVQAVILVGSGLNALMLFYLCRSLPEFGTEFVKWICQHTGRRPLKNR